MPTEAPRPETRRPGRPRARQLRLLAIPNVVLFGCVSCTGGEASDRPGDRDETAQSEILVSAAASLSDAFVQISTEFEAQNPGIKVHLNLAGSSALRAQILEGAPVDVFASASQAIMDELTRAGRAPETPSVFARNSLQIVVPTDNPGRVAGLGDFARGELLLGLCAQTVPCGDLARRALTQAGVTPAIDSSEPDVRALLTKVRLGELDAGIVYLTDVSAAEGAVLGITIPAPLNQTAHYPIAVLRGAPNPVGAQAFVDFVLSPPGQSILSRHGFGSP